MAPSACRQGGLSPGWLHWLQAFKPQLDFVRSPACAKCHGTCTSPLPLLVPGQAHLVSLISPRSAPSVEPFFSVKSQTNSFTKEVERTTSLPILAHPQGLVGSRLKCWSGQEVVHCCSDAGNSSLIPFFQAQFASTSRRGVQHPPPVHWAAVSAPSTSAAART